MRRNRAWGLARELAGPMLMGACMRAFALIVVLLAGCEIPYPGHDPGHGDDVQMSCSNPPPAPQGCSCSGGSWYCNTCGFGEGERSVACSVPGGSCFIYTWEHDCDCSCGADGWWHCSEGTVGSRCPQGEPKDAAVPDTVDSIIPDAAACSPVEAEAIGEHAGWFVVFGNLSGDMGLTAGVNGRTLSLAFTGETFAVTHERGPSMGEFSVSIDGQAGVSVNGYQPGNFDFATTAIASGLANTVHDVTITCVTATCTFDVFPVSCN